MDEIKHVNKEATKEKKNKKIRRKKNGTFVLHHPLVEFCECDSVEAGLNMRDVFPSRASIHSRIWI